MLNERAGPELPTLDIDELVEGQRVRSAAVVFLAIATMAMISDGFDIAAMGFVVPELAKQWHVTPPALAPALTAGVLGLLTGAPLFGYLGDRFGRKTAVLASLTIVGTSSLATIGAASLGMFVVLRFITGVALGGLIPSLIALAAEIAPKRRRGVFIIIVNFGLPAGFAIPGWVAALLVPQYGWPALMLLGGVLPLVIAVMAYFWLPESIAFLVQRGGRDKEVTRNLRKMRPDLSIADAAWSKSAAGPDPGWHGASPAKLFSGSLGFITPVFWLAYATNQFANFFTLSWLPTLLQSSGLSTSQAGVTTSMFSVGGLAGGFALAFIVDRFGALPMVFLFLAGAPLVAAIGSPHLSPLLLGGIIAGAGFCVTGNNFGASAVVGMLYPTAIRSVGAGWGQAFGRLGSLAAQIAGGMLLASGMSVQSAYSAPALVLALGAVASIVRVLLCRRRFGGLRLDNSLVRGEPGGAGPVAGKATVYTERPIA